MASAATLFDRRLVRLRRARIARRPDAVDFFHEEMAERLAERLLDIRRSFARVLVIGRRRGELVRALDRLGIVGGLVVTDVVPAPGVDLVAEDELLPFRRGAFDVILSAGVLHLANDLPGLLAQARWALAPGGLFLVVFPGGGSLAELRTALTHAELEVTGGAAPRIAPFVDVRDGGALLQRAGFELPVADSDRLAVEYSSILRLLDDLRRMGEGSVMRDSVARPLRPAVLARAAEHYARAFTTPSGRLAATLEMIFLTGWAPRPAEPEG